MSTDSIIAFIRFLRKLGLLDIVLKLKVVVPVVFVLLLAVGGFFAFAGGGGDAPADVDVKNATNLTMNDNGDGTITFTLGNNSSVDRVVLKVDEEPVANLTETGQQHTMSADQRVVVSAFVDGNEALLRVYDPNTSGEGAQGNETTLTAALDASSQSVPPGENIEFTAENSTVPNSSGNVSYEWIFGDETNATGVTANHSYSEVGEYDVTLTLTDEEGENDTTTTTINVGNDAPFASISGQGTGTTQTVFEFDASSSSDPNGDDLTYEWTLNGNETATGPTVDHQFSDVGTFEVTLNVTDQWGASDTATTTVTIENTPPTAQADFPSSAEAGNSVDFDASNSSDPDGQNLTYEWSFGDGTSKTGESPTHTYDSSGTYTVRLYVTDESGASDLYRALVSVTGSTTNGGNDGGGGTNAGNDDVNDPPTASLSAPDNAELGVPVDFDGQNSYDPEGDDLSYNWDFGDGTTATGADVTNTYDQTGSYTVMLVVSDGENTDTATTTIDIQNAPPTANAQATPFSTHPSETVQFDGSNSDDPNEQSLTYEWEFGDNSPNATVENPSHQYTEVGTYDATLTVTDPAGESDTDSVTITVENRAPSAQATVNETSTNINNDLAFDATSSSDADGQSLTYEWDFGDNSPNATGATPVHSYSQAGSYTVTMTVTDSEGASDTDTLTVNVENRDPVVDVTVNRSTVNVGDEIAFDGSGTSDPDDGQTLTNEWDFDDDGSVDARSETVTYAYAEPGTYDANFTARDGKGGVSSTNVTITVENRAPTADYTANSTDVYANEDIALDASASSDPDGESLTYQWIFDNSQTRTEGPNTIYSYTAPGTYDLVLNVSDPSGGDDATVKTITVTNRAPTATGTANRTTVAPGEDIAFSAVGSSDPDGHDITYNWDWGDGTEPGSVQDDTHSYSSTGQYTVTLTVSDGYDSDTYEIVIDVQ